MTKNTTLTTAQMNTITYVQTISLQEGEQLDARIVAHAAHRYDVSTEHLYSLYTDAVIDSSFLLAIGDQLFRWNHCPRTLARILTEQVFIEFVHAMRTSTQKRRRQRKSELNHEHTTTKSGVRTSFRDIRTLPARELDLRELCVETVQTLLFGACNTAAIIAPVSIHPYTSHQVGGATIVTHWTVVAHDKQEYRCTLGDRAIEWLTELCEVNSDALPDERVYTNVMVGEVSSEVDDRTGKILIHEKPVRYIRAARRPNGEPMYNSLVSAVIMAVFNINRLEHAQQTIGGAVNDRHNVWNIESYHTENERYLEEVDEWVNETFGVFNRTMWAIIRDNPAESSETMRVTLEHHLGKDVPGRSFRRSRERLYHRIRKSVHPFNED